MNESVLLPPLREDLQLLPGSPDEDGAPRWLLFDSMRNRYFALSPKALELVRLWQPGISSGQLAQRLQYDGSSISDDEVTALASFMVTNNLTQARDAEASARVHQQYTRQLLGFWRWLLHNYLFIRIPLLRPDRWLNYWTPRLCWLFSDAVHYAILILGAIGGILVLRQWDAFWLTFLHFFTLQGLLFYGLTLALVKSVHELGHAFVAKRQGCRVASMGVALLVMFPVLYTDTTDAWRLRSRAARLKIVTAGVRSELYLALLATFLWNVLPDGPMRSAAFFVATTSWVTSLLVNISPFLRFDGYYAFSDWLGIENLQQRAFAVGRWRLRELLWGFKDPLPEPMPRHRARVLVSYAWATWVYRFFLFLGIALLVYHMFFKVLGIVLFVVEVLWFIVLPMMREMGEWWQRRSSVRLSGLRLVFWLGVSGLLLPALWPQPGSIYLPAVLLAERSQSIFAMEEAQVAEVWAQLGEQVEEGQLLIHLRSDELEFELRQVNEELGVLQTKLRRSAVSARDRARRVITEQQYQRLLERRRGLQKRKEQLQIHAPFGGTIAAMSELHPGVWVNVEQPLLQLVSPRQYLIEGFVSEQDLALLESGQHGVFVADQGDIAPLQIEVGATDIGSVFSLPYPELSSQYEGPIAVRPVTGEQLIPESAHYRVALSLSSPPSDLPQARLSGIAIIEGRSRIWLWQQLKLAVAPLIRESGF